VAIVELCRTCRYVNNKYDQEPCAGCLGFDRWTAPLADILPTTDPINSPPHYQHGGIETIDIIRMALTDDQFIGYLKGNILKYRERAQFKGKADEDYKKAEWYYKKLQEVQHGSARD